MIWLKKITKKKTVTPIIQLTPKKDYHYCFKTSQDTADCTGECRDEGICRCSRIINIKIEEINTGLIIDKIIPKKYQNSILGYCAERILRLCGISDINNWEVDIIGGYYGEEIGGIYLVNQVYNIISTHLDSLMTQSDKQRMEYVLELEYGYTLPILVKKTWVICRVPRDNLRIGQEQYYDKKLSPNIVKEYADYQFPIAICIKIDDYCYRIIDGYHRFAASKQSKKVTIIVAE